MVLVTGPAGSGKSSTLAAMIEHINHTVSRRIVTIEEPIEYLFEVDKSVITQREVGTPAVRNLIREAKTPQMVNAIQTGREHGMVTLDQALRDLYRNQQITLEAALENVSDAQAFKKLLKA